MISVSKLKRKEVECQVDIWLSQSKPGETVTEQNTKQDKSGRRPLSKLGDVFSSVQRDFNEVYR